MVQLHIQRRMAMKLFRCGRGKVWLDPERKVEIAKAKTREQMRQLIADGAVVDKSVYSKRKAFQWAEVNDTHATLTFAERWKEAPIATRLWHQLPRKNPRRGI